MGASQSQASGASTGTTQVECPVLSDEQDGASSSACPLPEAQRHSSMVYDVYSRRIDGAAKQQQQRWWGLDRLNPLNNMPVEANQQPCAGQRRLISTDRQASNIPKGGTESTWLYPSPQMFYNALKRKGKGDDVAEEDMDAVVHAHNSMNEMTWQAVQVWEQLHRDECGHSRLLRFEGKPDRLSPLARLSSLVGGPLPFDRHDWVVDRCGQEVRYIIDFYFDDAKAGSSEAFSLRVRPALDSPVAALDRVKMSIYTTFAAYGLPCPVTGHKTSEQAASGGLRTTESS